MTSTFSHDSIQNSFMSFRKRRKLEMEQKTAQIAILIRSPQLLSTTSGVSLFYI